MSWIVEVSTKTSNLNKRDSPSTSGKILGKVSKGAQLTIDSESTDSAGNVWYHCLYGGYYCAKLASASYWYLNNVTDETSTVSSNSSTTNDATTSSGSQSSQEYLTTGLDSTTLSAVEEANNLLAKAIDGSVRMFGMPHQLTAENDMRISTTSKLGRVFAETHIMDAPVVYLRPGTANFLPDGSADDQKGMIQAIKDLKTDKDDAAGSLQKKLAEIETDQTYVKYFTFKEQFANYMSKVNLLCRLGSVFLKVDKEKVPWHGSGTTMTFGMYDWRGYKFKNLYTNSNLTPNSRFGSAFMDWFGNLGAFIPNTLQTSIASDDTYVQFYVDANLSFSEAASNGTTQSMLTSFTDSVESIGKELAFISGASGVAIDDLATATSSSVDNVINSIATGDSAIGTLFKRLTGVGNQLIAGSNFVAPDIWSDSDYSKSYSFTITLSTPYGNELSWYLNIFVPLMHILAMALPVQQAANAFSAPPLVRAFSPGWFSCDLGIISSIDIDKGSDSSWSSAGLPTEVRVNIDVKDLYSNLAIPNMYNVKDFFTNDNLISYLMVNCGLDLTNQSLFTKIDVMVNLFKGSIEDKIVGGISDKYQHLKDFVIGKIGLYK